MRYHCRGIITLMKSPAFSRPQKKVCNGQGPEQCKTIYETSCTTKYIPQANGENHKELQSRGNIAGPGLAVKA